MLFQETRVPSLAPAMQLLPIFNSSPRGSEARVCPPGTLHVCGTQTQMRAKQPCTQNNKMQYFQLCIRLYSVDLVCRMHAYDNGGQKRALETVVKDSCESQSNPGPLQEQWGLLTTKTSLQLHIIYNRNVYIHLYI